MAGGRMSEETRGAVVTPHITYLSRDEVQQRRRSLLERAGMDVATLRHRAEELRLSPEQEQLLQELDDLEFLAGE